MSEANVSRVYYNKLKRKNPKQFRKLSYRSWQSQQISKWKARQEVKRERLTNIENIRKQADNGTIYYYIGLEKTPRKTTPERFQQIRQKELSRAKIITRKQYDFKRKAASQPKADRVKIVTLPGQKPKYFNIDSKKGREAYNKLVLQQQIKGAHKEFKSGVEYKRAKSQYEKSKSEATLLLHQQYKAETFGAAGIAPYKKPGAKPISDTVSYLKPDVYSKIYGFEDEKIISSAKETVYQVPPRLKEMGTSLGRGLYKTIHWRAATQQGLFSDDVIDPVTGYPDTIKDPEVKTAAITTATIPFFYIPGVSQAAALYGSARIGTGLRTYDPGMVAEGSLLVAPYIFEKGFRFVKTKGGKAKTRYGEFKTQRKVAKIESKYLKFDLPKFTSERVFIESPFIEKGIGKLPAKGESPLQFIETIKKPIGYDVIRTELVAKGVDPLLATDPYLRQTTLTGELGTQNLRQYEVIGTTTAHTEAALIKAHPWDLTKYPSKPTGKRLIKGDDFLLTQDIFKQLEGTKISRVKASEFQRSLTEYKPIEFKTVRPGQKLLEGATIKVNLDLFRGAKSLFKHKGAQVGRGRSITKGDLFSSKSFGERWRLPEKYTSPFKDIDIIKPLKPLSKVRSRVGIKPIKKSRSMFKELTETNIYIKGGIDIDFSTDIGSTPRIKLTPPKQKQRQEDKLGLVFFTKQTPDRGFKFVGDIPPIEFKPPIPPPPPRITEPIPKIKIDFDLDRGYEKRKKPKKLKKSKRKYKYTATFEAAFEKQFMKKGKGKDIFTGLERRSLLL